MAFCSSVQCTVYLLYSEVALSQKPFGIGHMYMYTILLRMTDTMASQNIHISSWDTVERRPDYVAL
jgi:hypothetical protein